MTTPIPKTRPVELAALGERLAPLRLCDAKAQRMMGRSLERHGQLSPLTVFVEDDALQLLDGFKRVRAATALGWSRLYARVDEVSGVDAKLRLAELHAGRGLSELEEGWLVRSLYREDGLTQPQAEVSRALTPFSSTRGADIALTRPSSGEPPRSIAR